MAYFEETPIVLLLSFLSSPAKMQMYVCPEYLPLDRCYMGWLKTLINAIRRKAVHLSLVISFANGTYFGDDQPHYCEFAGDITCMAVTPACVGSLLLSHTQHQPTYNSQTACIP